MHVLSYRHLQINHSLLHKLTITNTLSYTQKLRQLHIHALTPTSLIYRPFLSLYNSCVDMVTLTNGKFSDIFILARRKNYLYII